MDTEVLFAACERYQAMQEAHLQLLTDGEWPDLERLVFEREQRFAEVYNHLTALVHTLRTAGASALPIEQARQRVHTLLQQDALLTAQLHRYRTRLERHRWRLQHELKALSGYSPSPQPSLLLGLA